MSARRIETTGSFQQSVTVEARETRLELSPDAVVIHKSGIEFRSPTPMAAWTEMTLALRSPGDQGLIRCSGVVISCTGNKHTGYHISMIFTSLSKQSQARLETMAFGAQA
ncbi:MAG: hypothetical protein U1F98_02090 [Verrucomicrobiota bacterium]